VDVYERSGGTTALVSAGPVGGSGNFDVYLDGGSSDGARVFFTTQESLVAQDGDVIQYDVYERSGGTTTLVSTGPIGGNGAFDTFLVGRSADGARVFLTTEERLAAADTDSVQDLYQASAITGYPRPKGATPLRASLVVAYAACAAPNRTHGPSLAYPSCAPPSQTSAQLTVGSPDANGRAANAIGSVRLDALPGNAGTTADEADVRFTISITDVRRRDDLSDYAGELLASEDLRITDRLSGSVPQDPATVQDTVFQVTVPCSATGDTAVGSTCSVTTTADAAVPGVVREQRRTMWQMGRVEVFDGGVDGLAGTQPNALFAVQGLLVP
jgi:hypothetical protein